MEIISNRVFIDCSHLRIYTCMLVCMIQLYLSCVGPITCMPAACCKPCSKKFATSFAPKNCFLLIINRLLSRMLCITKQRPHVLISSINENRQDICNQRYSATCLLLSLSPSLYMINCRYLWCWMMQSLLLSCFFLLCFAPSLGSLFNVYSIFIAKAWYCAWAANYTLSSCRIIYGDETHSSLAFK